MLFIRLILFILAIGLIGFGIHPALEYSNAGAIAMLGLAVFLIVVAVFLRPLMMLKRTIIGKLLALVFSLAVVYFIAIEALIIVNSQPVDPLPESDAIIVLGAGLTYGTDEPSLALSYRLDEALKYLEKYPNTPVIVSGGRGEVEQTSEANAMRKYLTSKGIPASQIYLEDKSTTTAENLNFSSEIMKEHDFKTASIITSDYHCFRAKILAERAGINATCVPSPNVWWLSPADHFREFLSFNYAIVNEF